MNSCVTCLARLSRKGDGAANGRSLEDVERLLSQLQRQYRKALEAMRQKVGPQHPNTLQCLADLARFLAERGCLDEAEQLLKEVVVGWAARGGEDGGTTRHYRRELDNIQSEKKRLVAGELSQLEMEDAEAVTSLSKLSAGLRHWWAWLNGLVTHFAMKQSTRDNREEADARAAVRLSVDALRELPGQRGSSTVLSGGSGQTEAVSSPKA